MTGCLHKPMRLTSWSTGGKRITPRPFVPTLLGQAGRVKAQSWQHLTGYRCCTSRKGGWTLLTRNADLWSWWNVGVNSGAESESITQWQCELMRDLMLSVGPVRPAWTRSTQTGDIRDENQFGV